MPAYRITSGNWQMRIITPYPAEASALALYALTKAVLEHGSDEAHAAEGGPQLGWLLEVKGGQYRNGRQVYFGTAQLLRALGRMDGADQ